MTKPWEENWQARDDGGVNGGRHGGRILCDARTDGPPDLERARLAAAAPDLVRALLAVEWSGVDLGRPFGDSCAACGDARHSKKCPVDAALTAAGLPSQAERNAARKWLAGKLTYADRDRPGWRTRERRRDDDRDFLAWVRTAPLADLVVRLREDALPKWRRVAIGRAIERRAGQ